MTDKQDQRWVFWFGERQTSENGLALFLVLALVMLSWFFFGLLLGIANFRNVDVVQEDRIDDILEFTAIAIVVSLALALLLWGWRHIWWRRHSE